MSNKTLVEDIYAFNKQSDLLGKGMDSFMEAFTLFTYAIAGYEDVFNQPNDPRAPVVTAESWSLGFLNQIKEAKELRNLPMPTNEDEINKYTKITIAAISNLLKLGKSPIEVEQLIKAELHTMV